ncbi:MULTISPECIES: transposase [Streptosporangium]|nr:transposase [Streptosporangium brasiliense]
MEVHPPEFKADAVALYLADPARTIVSVARDLGISPETLRLWARQAQPAGTSSAPPTGRPRTTGGAYLTVFSLCPAHLCPIHLR